MKRYFISAKDFRKNIFKALDDIAENFTPYVITKNGQPTAIVMSIDEIEALMETYDILADKELMKQINDYKRNKKAKLIPWDSVKEKT